MTKLLIKLFIKDSEKTDDPAVRSRYGTLSGIVGILCTILLTAAKFIVGSATGSIAITADAANNLSDAGSSAVTLVSFRLANKILHPEPLQFSMTALRVLLASIGVKIWMAVFNRNIGKRINSTAVGAVVMDSVSDTAATTVSMIALILSKFTSVPLDGYMGIVVALFIIATGIGIFKDTMNELLGAPASPETVQEIESDILSYEGVIGVHDLMVHDYGPGRMFASAHVEVPSDCDIMACHDTIDRIERDIKKKFAINIVLHMDPIVVDDEHINALREKVGELIKEVDPRFTMHDFRMVEGPTHTNLIFDLVVPHKYPFTKGQIKELISDRISTEIGENYYAVMTIENSFVEDERK